MHYVYTVGVIAETNMICINKGYQLITLQYFQRCATPSIISARAIDPEEDNWLVLKWMQNICSVVDTDTPSYSRAFLLNKSNNEETKWKNCGYVLSLPLLSSSSRFRCMTVHFFTSAFFCVIGFLSKKSQILWIVSCPSVVLLLREQSTMRARVWASSASVSLEQVVSQWCCSLLLPSSSSSSLPPSLPRSLPRSGFLVLPSSVPTVDA